MSLRHVLAAFALSAAPALADPVCEDPMAPVAGYAISERTLVVNGVTRWYCLVTPAGYSLATEYPFVIVLHGGSGDPRNLTANGKRFLELFLPAGYVLVFPVGSPDPDPARCPPAEPCDRNFWNGEANLDFLDELVAEADRRNLDPARLYLAGFSGGAQLIYRALERKSLPVDPAAIATAAGSLGNLDAWNPEAGIEVINVAAGIATHALVFQGGRDDKIAFEGGLSDGDTEVHLSFTVKVDLFRVRTGNAATVPVETQVGNFRLASYAGGSHEVLSVANPQTGHLWPGDLTPFAFDFFEAHGAGPRGPRPTAP